MRISDVSQEFTIDQIYSAKRASKEYGELLNSYSKAVEYLGHIHTLPYEKLVVVACSNDLRVIECQEFTQYSPNSVNARAEDIVRFLILCNASAFIVAHNHPSGGCTFSASDKVMTEELISLSKRFGIKMSDHILFPYGCSTLSYTATHLNTF